MLPLRQILSAMRLKEAAHSAAQRGFRADMSALKSATLPLTMASSATGPAPSPMKSAATVARKNATRSAAIARSSKSASFPSVDTFGR